MEKLTKQEEDVMRVIWQLRKCGVKDVVEVLPAPKPPYTTVASVINNLKNITIGISKQNVVSIFI